MSISTLPATAGNPLRNLLAALQTRYVQWQQERAQRIDEQRTIALLQSLDPALVDDIGATAYLAGKQPPATSYAHPEVGPMLAIYLPLWDRNAVNDAANRVR